MRTRRPRVTREPERPVLISVSGIDCSGKTTQIEKLRRDYAARGRRVEVVWYRPGYSPFANGLRSLVRRLRPGALPPAGRSEAREAMFSKAWIRRSWIALALVDAYFHYVVRLRWLLLRGYVVISDRYVPDAVLDLELAFSDHDTSRLPGVTLLRRLSPRPAKAFLLLLPEEEMVRRMLQKDEPFPDDERTRKLRFRAYERLVADGSMIPVDAARDVETVHAELRRHLEGAPRAAHGHP